MIDPITALATATAVFNGLKKAVEINSAMPSARPV
jgi:hypothetical protein